MSEVESERVAIRFVNEINRHDVAALTALMTPDIRFVDSLSHEVRGRERMSQAWTAYFELFPDYRITIREHLCLGQTVGLFGTASGSVTEPGNPPVVHRWTLPAAWRALVWEGHVSEWQVYMDNQPVAALLNSARAGLSQGTGPDPKPVGGMASDSEGDGTGHPGGGFSLTVSLRTTSDPRSAPRPRGTRTPPPV